MEMKTEVSFTLRVNEAELRALIEALEYLGAREEMAQSLRTLLE